jgi:myo-inositol-1(or 4)-monophosphatase
MNLEEITQKVADLCQKVGLFIKAEQSKINSNDIEVKNLNSFVSYVDKEAEMQLVSELKTILPEAGFIAEEGTETKQGEVYNWIIDPLDGTTNYLHNLPVFAISIALAKNKEMVAGVIYEIGFDEMFTAWKEGGAFLNNKAISVKSTSELQDTLLATGFPYYDFNRLPKYLNLLSDCFQKTRGVRRFGSAAVDLAYVACGRFDGFFEYGLNAWDVAAGALIVQEAGGIVTDFKNGQDHIFGREILAGSTAIFEDLENLVQSHMNG